MTDCLQGGFHFSEASKLRKHFITLLFAVLSCSLAPASYANITLVSLASGLALPVDIANAGDGSGRLFVVEQGGRIRIIQNGFLLATPFLNLATAPSIVTSGGERGLLGLAFHPQYASNGQFFVYFTGNANAGAGLAAGDIVIARYQRSAADPNFADPASRVNILTIPHSTYINHNGGSLRFGPDGYLYAGVGDGGSGGDPFNSGQDLNSLLGKILRIDVTGVPTYTIPPTNPFVGIGGTRPEIWAYGVRNPWRISFDRSTGDFYIGDVGQDTWEEIDMQPAGGSGGANYGWRILEGTHCYNPSSGCVMPPDYVAPILEYNHSEGNSVTGGYVYRGQSTPDLAGKYVFGDFTQSKLWYAPGLSGASYTQITGLTPQVSTFGEGESAELYLANYSTGTISSFSSSTDNTPDPVVFFPVSNVPLSTTTTSNLVKLTGLGVNADISITGGEYTVSPSNSTSCSNSYTTAASMVATDGFVCVRHISAGTVNSTRTTTLTVGTATINFVSTTLAAVPVFDVTPSVGPNGFLSPNSVQQAQPGQTAFFMITPAAGYTPMVTGTCGGNLNGTNYTTNPVTANCTVVATFTLNTYAVTPSAGTNGTITPATVQSVNHGATTSFTVAPNAGYTASVGGTCGGTLNGALYSTVPITAPCTVAASFTFVPLVPDAPTIGSAVAGDTQASIGFTPPLNNGSANVNRYTATCIPGGAMASRASSPITVSGLMNGTMYSCRVTATNSAGTGPASATVDVTPVSGATLTRVAVKSRRLQGGVTFNLPIDTAASINGPLTVEPRMIGAGHTIVFEFNIPIMAPGTALATNASAAQIGTAFTATAGNDVVVTLTGIPDNRRITLTLSDVNNPGFTTAVSLAFLVGDVNGTQTVNASDISAIKAHLNQPLDNSNFRFDLNASGAVDAADVTAVKARSGLALP